MSERMLVNEVESAQDRIIFKKKNVDGIDVSIVFWIFDMGFWVYMEKENEFDTPINVKDFNEALNVYDTVERLIKYKEE